MFAPFMIFLLWLVWTLGPVFLLLCIFKIPTVSCVRTPVRRGLSRAPESGSLRAADRLEGHAEMDGSNTLAADHFIENRVVEGTRQGYKGKLRTMSIFLIQNGLYEYLNECITAIPVKVPIPFNIVKDMFGWIGTNTDIPIRSKRIKLLKEANEKFSKQSREASMTEEELYEEEDYDEDMDELELDEQGDIIIPDGPLDMFAAGSQTVTAKTMQGYKSALKWLYEEKRIVFPSEMDMMLDNFIAGYTRKVAEKKQLGIMSISEGKAPVSFSGFCYLCKVLMCLIPHFNLYPWKISIFGWSFETMSWNILGRCSNVNSLMLEHMDWSEDCLLVNIPTHKGDKSGDSIAQVCRHSYIHAYAYIFIFKLLKHIYAYIQSCM